MLAEQNNENIKNGEPVRSSQLDLAQLHAVIKKTYFELDRKLKNMVKDDSGCVCVSSIFLFLKVLFYFKYSDNMSHWPRTNLFSKYRRFSCYYFLK